MARDSSPTEPGGDDIQTSFDDLGVQLSGAEIPEPGTVLLIGTAFLALAGRRRLVA